MDDNPAETLGCLVVAIFLTCFVVTRFILLHVVGQ